MIYKILILSVFAILPVIIHAQQVTSKLAQSNYLEKAQQETDFQSAQLALTKQQKDSVLHINKDFYHEIINLNNEVLDVKEKSNRLASLQAIQQQRLKSVLNSGQYEKYLANIARFKTRSQQRLDSLVPKRKPNPIKN